jgi:preprotein translocase subunit YajC
MTNQEIIDALLTLLPPILVGGVFYIIMRGILRADRTERKVYAEMEAEMRAEAAAKASEK